jgi:hypothetical protein
MPELAQTLAFVAALLMVISIAIWSSWLRGPLLQRLDGQRAANAAPAALAMKLLIAAFGVSAVAAILAIGGWISP